MKLVALTLAALIFPFKFVDGDLLRELTLLDELPSLTTMLEPTTTLSTWFDPPNLLSFRRSDFPSFLRRDREFFNSIWSWKPVVNIPYEDKSNEDEFRMTVQLPTSMPLDKVKVNVEHAGRVLTIAGHQESTDGKSLVMSFQKSFTLDPTVVVEHLTAAFEDGVLTISAPKDSRRVQPRLRSIPIAQTRLAIAAADDAKDNDKFNVRANGEPPSSVPQPKDPPVAFATAAMKKAVHHDSLATAETKLEEFEAKTNSVKSELRKRAL